MKSGYALLTGLGIGGLFVIGAVIYPQPPPSGGTTVNFISSNFYSVSNFSQTINVSGKAQLNYLILTNGIGFATNTWSGPSNSVSMALSDPYDLNYVSLTKCEIQGITGKSNQFTSEKLLQILNNSSTNFNVTIANGFVVNAGGVITNTCTVSNATVGMFWLRYTPQGPRTNGMFQNL
jgi:hypothetical protein